jgi:hypothetical protein
MARLAVAAVNAGSVLPRDGAVETIVAPPESDLYAPVGPGREATCDDRGDAPRASDFGGWLR